MRRRLAAVAVVTALVAGLAGCGIPESSGVRVDGPGPAPNYGSGTGLGQVPPQRSVAGSEPQTFAVAYLEAAAGELGGAVERVREFIAPAGQPELRDKPGPDAQVNVVRLTELPRVTANADGTSKVDVSVQQIGILTRSGAIDPPMATATQYSFTVGRLAGNTGLFVLKPPPVLLLSTEAFGKYYQPRTIYFWNADQSGLIPDLRYLPLSVPRELQATEVLGWLTAGPSGSIRSIAKGLPDGTAPIGNAPATDGRLVVNLSAQAVPTGDDAELDRLATQLVWSLRPNLVENEELELKIQNQTRTTLAAEDQFQKHPVYDVAPVAERYTVYAGQVRRLNDLGEPPGSPAPIAPEANTGIVSAAIIRTGEMASVALVTAVGDRSQLQVGASTGAVRGFRPSGPSFASMGRPVWLRTTDPRGPVGLVVADGRLYQFGVTAGLTELELPGTSGPVTGVAPALDGHRIAYTAGDRLHVATLMVTGGLVEVAGQRQLTTSLADVSAVAWTDENRLVAAGLKSTRLALVDITVDGLLESWLDEDLPAAQVTHISAVPDNPVTRPGFARLMYEASGVAWYRLTLTGAQQIDSTEVAGVGSGDPAPEATVPTAPFFVY
ncbi:GerMN domain-containing protein [Polymorphospora sp. NPDC051019]|uniref:GerMN domain-containing protein n=1 Tax=unclassified Polymorphospora TaxID=2685497 RepID=UPI0034481DB0